MKFCAQFLLFLTFCFGQEIQDLINLQNRDLDRLRSSLIEESLSSDPIQTFADSPLPSKVLIPSTSKDNIPGYFGYNYFERNINFFDNIPTPASYVLGPGDEVILSLWGETNFRKSFIINKNGEIFYENLGFINLSNLSLDEAENKIKEKFSVIYSTLNGEDLSTRLSLELGKLKAINVYFTGNIKSPGIQLIHPFSDIFSAIIQADGVKIEGSLRQVQLIRNKEIISSVDFYSFFQDGLDLFSNIKLLDGDIIHIPNVMSRIKIQGAVTRPAYYELLPNEKLDSAVKYALDLNDVASSTAIIERIIPQPMRVSDDYAKTSINISLTESKNIDLYDGDVITINAIEDVSSKVEIFGRIKSPGRYSARDASLKDILDIAGGFNDPVFRKTINDEIVILRKDENQFYGSEFIVKYQDSESFPVEIGDKILVYEKINFENNETFFIKGEVNKPGFYPYRMGLTVKDALQRAEGITEIGTMDNIIITEDYNSSKMRVYGADLDYKLTKSTEIEVLQFVNYINISGNVYSPGLIPFEKGITVGQGISKAGGLKPHSIKNRLIVIKPNGERKSTNLFFGRFRKLNPGDTVIVPDDPNPDKFDITRFISDVSSTLANIVAILVLVEKTQ